jgi:hypothetical protein
MTKGTMERRRQHDQEALNNSGSSLQGTMLNDSFASTPNFGLLAMESSQQSLQHRQLPDEESLPGILELDEHDEDKDIELKPHLHRRHESSSFHFSFDESLDVCFGGEEKKGTEAVSCTQRVSLDKSFGSAMAIDKRIVSLEHQLEDRPSCFKTHQPTRSSGSLDHSNMSAGPFNMNTTSRQAGNRPQHFKHHAPSTSSGSLDMSIMSMASFTMDRSNADKKPADIFFVPDNIRRERSLRLERSLNLFVPAKCVESIPTTILAKEDLHETEEGTAPTRSAESVNMLGPTPVQRQPSLVESGVLTFPDGRRFEGQHLGKHHLIRGVMTYPDGTVFKGSWTNGKRQGRGVVDYPDGSRYHGDFDDGEFHGQGKLIWSDGGYYIGAWKHGQIQGKGKEVRADGSIRHDGWWKEGRPCRINVDPTIPMNDTPKVIHVVRRSSLWSLDSAITTGTSLSMSVTSDDFDAAENHGASLHPMDLLTYEV